MSRRVRASLSNGAFGGLLSRGHLAKLWRSGRETGERTAALTGASNYIKILLKLIIIINKISVYSVLAEVS